MIKKIVGAVLVAFMVAGIAILITLLPVAVRDASAKSAPAWYGVLASLYIMSAAVVGGIIVIEAR